MNIPASLLPYTVTLRPYVGTTATGPAYGPATVHRAYVEDVQRLIKRAGAEEVAATTTVWLDPEVVVPVGSKVTVRAATPREKESTVITSTLYEHPQAPSHVQIYLE